MSYILDALKKSDSERQQRQGPILATAQHQQYVYHRSSRSWLTLLLAALMFALASAGFWLVQLGYIQFAAPRFATPLPVATAVVADNTAVTSSKPSNVPVENTPVVVAPRPEPAPRQHPDTMPPADAIPELWQLPAALRAGVPPLDFSLHVYSTLREQRSIIINNRMMREGETINSELALSAITPEGVVMKYRNEYFRVSILDNW